MPEVMTSRSDLHVLQTGPVPPFVQDQIDQDFVVHRIDTSSDPEALVDRISSEIRAIISFGAIPIDSNLMQRLPKLEIVSIVGVGYDYVDAAWAGQRGIVVTNTPEVLTEETADTALGLLINTVRELPQAERYLRAGKWIDAPYPLTFATLRNRTFGIVGMGRIGQAIARRLEAFRLPVVYHSRRPVVDVGYRHYPSLVDMANEVDVLIAIVPGGPSTDNLIDRSVLDALGSNGILINMARGSVVDEPALIEALRSRRILAAGLDVFADEPHVPKELIEMENVCLLPHVGTASVYTRHAMGQVVVDNLKSWAAGRGPLTPVKETPWPTLSENH